MHCVWCGSSRLSNSPLKSADIPKLFLLQAPVRCHFCNERYSASLFSVLKLNSAARARRRERQSRESWPA
jgi:hypothetical protein